MVRPEGAVAPLEFRFLDGDGAGLTEEDLAGRLAGGFGPDGFEGTVEVVLGGRAAGHLFFRVGGAVGSGLLDVYGTRVLPEFNGRGLGGLLVKRVFGLAEGAGLRVMPTCSFVGTWLDRHPAYEHLAARS